MKKEKRSFLKILMLRRPDLSVIDNLKPVKSLLIVIFSGKPSPELGTFSSRRCNS